MAVNPDNESDLDQLLSSLGAARKIAPDGLIARIESDAAHVLAGRFADAGSALIVSPRRPSSIWSRISDAIGGNWVAAGLGGVAVAGIAVGFIQPTPMADWTASALGQGEEISVDLMAETNDFWTEG
jgi:hypothetical protein